MGAQNEYGHMRLLLYQTSCLTTGFSLIDAVLRFAIIQTYLLPRTHPRTPPGPPHGTFPGPPPLDLPGSTPGGEGIEWKRLSFNSTATLLDLPWAGAAEEVGPRWPLGEVRN